MAFELKHPCDACPFLKNSPIKLARSRAKEIADNMLSFGGGTFPCHKTVKYCNSERGGCKDFCVGHDTKGTQHCAGALIFAEANRNATQMMRIGERLGMYDHQALQGKELVFSTKKEMIAFHSLKDVKRKLSRER